MPRDVADVEQISPPAWTHSTIWYLCTITLHIGRTSMVPLLGMVSSASEQLETPFGRLRR